MVDFKTHEQQFAMQVIRQQQHDEFILYGPFFIPVQERQQTKVKLDKSALLSLSFKNTKKHGRS